jgi:CBS domain containing-hemolysin-like protein
MLILAVLLVALNALFVAAEFAFVKVRVTRLEVLARGGDRRARAALFGRANLDSYLSVCQLGITLASLGLGWLGEPAVAAILGPAFAIFGLDNPALLSTLSFVLGFALITFVHVVFGEQAPKIISIRAAEATALALARPMRLFYFLFRPGVKLLNSAANLAVRSLGGAESSGPEAHSTDELKLLIAEAKAGGQLDADEERFVNNIFNLDRRHARDIMVHRTKVVALEAAETVGTAIDTMRAEGFTRLPIYEGGKDNVVGFVHAKDLLGEAPALPLRRFVRPALYVFDHAAADDILAAMRREGRQFGLVWDEYGSWQGLVTMENLMEAIVGDIQDEFDHEAPRISPRSDGSFLVAPGVSPYELSAHLPLNLGPDAAEHYHTLAALLAEHCGEVPAEGDCLRLYGAEFSILKTEGQAIGRLLVRPLGDPD